MATSIIHPQYITGQFEINLTANTMKRLTPTSQSELVSGELPPNKTAHLCFYQANNGNLYGDYTIEIHPDGFDVCLTADKTQKYRIRWAFIP